MKSFYVKDVQKRPNYLLLTLRPRKQRDVLNFAPGQYATIGFNSRFRPSPVRCFSMVSSPGQPNELQFAMRVQGNFTQQIADLKAGDKVSLQGPYGSFVIDPAYDKNIVLLAGGIGITPFMSMVRHATESQSTIPITLLYGCRSQADIPFYDELIALQQKNPHLRVVFFIGDGEITPQTNAQLVPGKISPTQLQRITGGRYNDFTYFICGPDGFRDGLEKQLTSWQVEPTRIVSESFAQANKGSDILGVKISTATYGAVALGFLVLVGFFMTIDLVRYIPRASASIPTATQQVIAPVQIQSSAQSQGTATSTTPTPTPAPTQVQTNYHAPRTAVS
jgi:ferredoxin-NADP reductase